MSCFFHKHHIWVFQILAIADYLIQTEEYRCCQYLLNQHLASSLELKRFFDSLEVIHTVLMVLPIEYTVSNNTFVKNGCLRASFAVIRLCGLIVNNRDSKSNASLIKHTINHHTLMDRFLEYIYVNLKHYSFVYQIPTDSL